jgi:hypothetical protein
MPNRPCPNCMTIIHLSDEDLSLGLPFRCGCGCKWELIAEIKKPELRLTARPVSTQNKQAPPSITVTQRVQPTKVTQKVVDTASERRALIYLLLAFGATFLTLKLQWLLLLLGIVSTATAISYFFKKRWQTRDQKAFWYFFFDKSAEFFMPITVASAFFLVVAFIVDGTTNQTTLERLESLERFLDTTKSVIGRFMPGPLIAAVVIFSLLTIDLLLSMYGGPNKLAATYRKGQKWIKRAYAIVLVLCSFTFFNNVVGERRAELKAKTTKIRGSYSQVRNEVESALSASVQKAVYEKIQSRLPPDVARAFNNAEEFHEAVSSLRDIYGEAKTYRIKDPEVESLLAHYRSPKTSTTFNEKSPLAYVQPDPKPTRPDPEVYSERSERVAAQISEESTAETLREIEIVSPPKGRLVTLLKLDSTRSLFCQFPKSLTGTLKSAAFSRAIEEYPVLGPITDFFVGLLDKQVEKKVNESADKLADSLLRNPERANELLFKETNRITESIEVQPPTSLAASLKAMAADIKARVSKVHEVSNRLSLLVADRRPKPDIIEPEPPTVATRPRFRDPLDDIFGRDIFGRKRKIDPDAIVDCYCGSRFIGTMKASQCPEGQPCGP